MSNRTMSLRLRLFIVILTPLLCASIVLGYWRFTVAQSTAEELFDRGLLAAALAISRDVTFTGGDALTPRTRQLISDAGGGEVFYHVTGPGGIYITGYAYPPASARTGESQVPQYSAAVYRGEEVRVLRMVEPTVIDNLTGETIVTVWQRVSDRDAFATELARRAAGLIGAMMLTLVVVVWFGVKLGLRPLNDLRQAIEIRSTDDLSDIRRSTPTEVVGIVATLNRLLAQVRESISAHQAFISDAAHQLRNPASAMLSLAETLPGVSDPEERQKRERALIAAARKSARLTEQLLSLERLRYGDGIAEPTLFDLNDVVTRICSEMGPEVLGRGLNFELRADSASLPILGDPVLVEEAIGNLIDNAMVHGGPDLSQIIVTTLLSGEQGIVTVRDDGKGLAPKDRDLAFRRCGQVETGAGSGLGLSIVERVALRHRGRVTVDDTLDGASLSLHLPLASTKSEDDPA